MFGPHVPLMEPTNGAVATGVVIIAFVVFVLWVVHTVASQD